MSEFKDILMNKYGLTSMRLAKEFLNYKIGDKIQTVTEMCERLDVARGTIQNSMKLLQQCHAIDLEARGHLGSFLRHKDMRILLNLAGIDFLVGVMPLPYSRHYEGLATGLIKATENEYEIPVNLAYMRGSNKRIDMLINNRYDFAIVSKLAAKERIHQENDILVVKDFGKSSFLSNHILMFHDPEQKVVRDGMRIAIDYDSKDHVRLTHMVCKHHNVEYCKMDYNKILKKVLCGEVDAAVWNEDEIKDNLINIPYQILETEEDEDTAAVLVIHKDREELFHLISDLVDVDTVLEYQKQVDDNLLTPSY